MGDRECWLCDSTDIVYIDIVGCRWCADHYDDVYLDGDS
jgi:hypothetical protein